ncbi:hypothetical protein M501DRAFT_1018783 [Patellaria atrata CBS 101060]|uniref:C2H2-type domain-containing protein n=1 Tax=Patellaria atrata CBS 101060 TaxID=1346257 RepID=A0A9P4S579_9PEZI|nr:hypothetical protein M501DRAFT_1018783 [Patellaria atrata CBS 101060]
MYTHNPYAQFNNDYDFNFTQSPPTPFSSSQGSPSSFVHSRTTPQLPPLDTRSLPSNDFQDRSPFPGAIQHNRLFVPNSPHVFSRRSLQIDPKLESLDALVNGTRPQVSLKNNTTHTDPLERFAADAEAPWDSQRSAYFSQNPHQSGVFQQPLSSPNFSFADYRSHPPSEFGSNDTGPYSDSGYGTQITGGRSNQGVDPSELEPAPSQSPLDIPFQDLHCEEPTAPPTPQPKRRKLPKSSQPHGPRSLAHRKPLLDPCSVCGEPLKCPSDKKKHDLKHNKPWKCDIPGCPNQEKGFTTINDLHRHKRCKHNLLAGKFWKCAAEGCKNKEKVWPRLDNFKQHLERMHSEYNITVLIKESECEESPFRSLTDDAGISSTIARRDRIDEKRRSFPGPSWKCAAEECGIKVQIWRRLDLFRGHVEKMHAGYDSSALIRASEHNESGPSFTDYSRDNPALPNQDWRDVSQAHPSVMVSPPAYTMSDPMNQDWERSETGARAPIGESPLLLMAEQMPTDRGCGQGDPELSTLDQIRQPSPLPQRSETVSSADSGALATLADVVIHDYSSRSTHGSNLDILPPIVGSSLNSEETDAPKYRQLSELASPGSVEASPTNHEREQQTSSRDKIDEEILQLVRAAIHRQPSRRKSSQVHKPSPLSCLAISQDNQEQGNGNGQNAPERSEKPEIIDLTTESPKDEDLLRKLRSLLKQAKPSRSKSSPRSSISSTSSSTDHCPKCSKFIRRKCDMKKHMKRHTRPYGCTFPTCKKSFGSKNDWKRHENSQHFQIEMWRCSIPSSSSSSSTPNPKVPKPVCAKLYYSRESFDAHLKNDHALSTKAARDEQLRESRIGRNGQSRFWCGFCGAIVPLKNKGVAAWDERFNHIDAHFKEGRNVRDWWCAEANKTKGQVAREMDRKNFDDGNSIDEDEAQSPGSSEAASMSVMAGEGSAQHVNPSDVLLNSDMSLRSSRKRKHDGSAGGYRARGTKEVMVYCCSCKDGPFTMSLRLYDKCMACEHSFCDRCVKDTVRVNVNAMRMNVEDFEFSNSATKEGYA